FMDLSLQEAAINMVGEFLIERQLTGRQPEVTGNRHRLFAPQGIYPCAGEDNWIVISCTNDGEWAALRDIIGEFPEGGFDRVEERRTNHGLLDERIASYTQRHEKNALMKQLQERGVPAGAVSTARDFMDSEHIRERGFFRELGGDHLEPLSYPGMPVSIDGKRHDDWVRAPRLGEHNEEVLSDLLGMTKDEIDGLKASGVLASRPSI
ncbi:MAG: CoA transferase, partial [Pseudomonadales bacterium]|nr:CoA transferase [Pseudomonadales bacterium]